MYKLALCEHDPIFGDALESECRKVLQEIGAGHEITVYRRGEDFLRTYLDRQRDYDLLLLDLAIDGIDGNALVKKICSVDSHTTVIFIVFKQDAKVSDQDGSYVYYLSKPVNGAVLRELITIDYERWTLA